jgi:hypothetical protein
MRYLYKNMEPSNKVRTQGNSGDVLIPGRAVPPFDTTSVCAVNSSQGYFDGEESLVPKMELEAC